MLLLLLCVGVYMRVLRNSWLDIGTGISIERKGRVDL
jgi:hypothetical protein